MTLLKSRCLLILAFWISLITSTTLAQQHGNPSEEEVVKKQSRNFSRLLITLIGTASDNTLLTHIYVFASRCPLLYINA